MTNAEKIPLYELVNIRHGYNDLFTLNIPHLIIDEGSAIGFIGPNGSGKSTLFRILAFLEEQSHGSVHFDGVENTEATSIRERVTLLLQDPYLLKRSVLENVSYGLRVQGDTKNLRERVDEALSWVGLPFDRFGKRQWYELSGGEAQRVALASRLILKPRVLILDEPTSNVDRESVTLIKDAIETIRSTHHSTLIISSHDHLWLNSMTDNIYRMHDGRIVGTGTENIIKGPWNPDVDDLWSKTLTNDERIFSTQPPDTNSIALLKPSEIIISNVKQSKISAQNMLQGTITSLMLSDEFDKVKVQVELHGISLTCSLTQHAVNELTIFPGKAVWVIFKASSLQW
jgi:tungstate transport system ATP-binding protein